MDLSCVLGGSFGRCQTVGVALRNKSRVEGKSRLCRQMLTQKVKEKNFPQISRKTPTLLSVCPLRGQDMGITLPSTYQWVWTWGPFQVLSWVRSPTFLRSYLFLPKLLQMSILHHDLFTCALWLLDLVLVELTVGFSLPLMNSALRNTLLPRQVIHL